MVRIIRVVRPSVVRLENSPMLITRSLAVVLGDLAQMGYDAQWGCISAADFGAPHRRLRMSVMIISSGWGEFRKRPTYPSMIHG
jgi:DNA (cytosine-5)-methyltransferase 1